MSKTRPVYDGTKCRYCGLNYGEEYAAGATVMHHPVLGEMCKICFLEVTTAVEEGKTWCTKESAVECAKCSFKSKEGKLCMRQTIYEKFSKPSAKRNKKKKAKVKEYIKV